MASLIRNLGPDESIFSIDSKTGDFKVTEAALSTNEKCPTFMVANINPRFDISYNLSRIEDIVRIAHEKQVDILVLPELSISGYVWEDSDRSSVLKHLKSSDNQQIEVKATLDRIKSGLETSNRGLKMVFLNNVRNDHINGRLYDSTFVLAPGIDCDEAFYDKVFLTPVEKLYFNRGSDRRLVIDTPWGLMGVMICYDICFVDMAKKYAFEDDVDILVTSAAWRTEATRVYPMLNLEMNDYYRYIWNLKHAAMASHNQVWSIGANCTGTFEKTGGRFCGRSGAWSPSGIPLVHASGEEEELLIMRNIEISGHMRHQAIEDFDYRLELNEVYREFKDIKPKRVVFKAPGMQQ